MAQRSRCRQDLLVSGWLRFVVVDLLIATVGHVCFKCRHTFSQRMSFFRSAFIPEIDVLFLLLGIEMAQSLHKEAQGLIFINVVAATVIFEDALGRNV